MEKRGLYALLMTGDEPRFQQSIAQFREYLTNEVGIPDQRVRSIPSNADTYSIVREIQDFFGSLQGNPDIVIAYFGHGTQDMIFPNGKGVPYGFLARSMSNFGRFIFINDSCNSGVSINDFKWYGLIPDQGLVLASSRADEKSYSGYFLDSLLKSYRKKKVFTNRGLGWSTVDDVIAYDPTVKDFSLWIVDNGVETEVMFLGERWKLVEAQPRRLAIQRTARSGKSIDHLLFPKNE